MARATADLPQRIDAQQALRLWLRLFNGAGAIEREIRRRLRGRYDVTLARFDLMAALARERDGVTMGELSRRLMVSEGNVTGLVDRLEAEGMGARHPHPSDRRSAIVALTDAGHAAFTEMAAAHAGWVDEIFAGLDDDEMEQMTRLLRKLRASVEAAGPQREDRP